MRRHHETEDQASRRFLLRLRGISSLDNARRFADAGPLQGDPGGLHYTHLGHFLYWVMAKGFTVPDRLGQDETEAFCALLERSDALGDLNPGICERLQNELRRANGGIRA